jgi:hypothetical protein
MIETMHFPARLTRGLAAISSVITLLSPGFLRAAGEDAPKWVSSAWTAETKGWDDVMPAPNLTGWFRVPIPRTGILGCQQWHVENQELVCDGNGGHDMLLLDRKLRNCIFHVEFCFTKIDGGKGYNSGVFIRTSRDGDIWHQAQVGSFNGGYWFGVTRDGATTKNFTVPTNPMRVKGAGEWNTFELTARGKNLSLWVNGMLANPFPDCGQAEGYVGLESEGYRITFRNIELKVLP